MKTLKLYVLAMLDAGVPLFAIDDSVPMQIAKYDDALRKAGAI